MVPFAGQAFETIVPAKAALHFFDGSDWERHRRVAMAFFNYRNKQQGYKSTMVNVADMLVDELHKNGESVNVMHLFGKATVEVVAKAILGMDDMNILAGDIADSHPFFGLFEGVTMIFEELGNRMSNPIPLLIQRFLTIPCMPSWIKDRVHMERGPALMQSFRKLIADSYGPAGMDSSLGVLPFLAKEGVDQETALGLVMNFLAAGSDPPTKVLSWIMMFLAENPEIQSKIRDDPQDEIILNCIKETLRLKPPSLDVLAQVSDPNGFVLDGKTIPQGAVVISFFRPLMVE